MLNDAILGKLDSPVDFWKNYLGFIVVKQIPQTVIGYTVLKNYNAVRHLNERRFWGLRKYKVHIFGHEEEFESLAFQEQDSVLAACATTAIWTMLNKAAADYYTVLKPPSEITRDAGNMALDGSRMFPNKGLVVAEICKAILNSGLEKELKVPDVADPLTGKRYVSNSYTKKIINAYSGLGIPIILVIEVPTERGPGLHAITVCGDKKLPLKPTDPRPEISWSAENIEKIYAHDDQFGPFTAIKFNDSYDINTPWTERHSGKLPTRIKSIIVPVYPKVRISYEDIEPIVTGLDWILTPFFDTKLRYDLVWDITLQFSEDYKKSISKSTLEDEAKMDLVTQCMPKYLWVVSCYVGTVRILDITFDATDMITGMIGTFIVSYLPEDFRNTLVEHLTLNRLTLTSAFIKVDLRYYDFLLEGLSPVKTPA